MDGGCFGVSRLSGGAVLCVSVIDRDWIMKKLCVIDVLEAIFTLALGEKHFTEMTGPRITEGSLSGLFVFMDFHNEQIATLQELKVSELFDDVALGAYCICSVARATRTTSDTVGCDL